MLQSKRTFNHLVIVHMKEADNLSPSLLCMLDYDALSLRDLGDAMEWAFPEESGEHVYEIMQALSLARITYCHEFQEIGGVA